MAKKSLIIAALSITLLSSYGFLSWAQKQPKRSIMANESGAVTTPSGLKYSIIKQGEGDGVKPGRMVSVHYTGWLFDEKAPELKGKKFDSSKDRNQPFQFLLGGHQVIQGWDEGVQGMKKGEIRRLIIPAHLGYGSRGIGGIIPGNATLIFDVELL